VSALANQQQALLADLFGPPAPQGERRIAAHVAPPWLRGFQTYQANGHAMAQAGLQSAYPVVAQLLGEDSFSELARALWHARPPQRGDIGQWGGELPPFLSASEQLADEPYLGDVARVEWALHQAGNAADQDSDTASFALLASVDPGALGLRLAPGSQCVASAWPVVSIVNAHLEQTPPFEEVGRRLRAMQAEVALVWREGLRPRVREALAGEAALLAALWAGQSLGAALDAATGLDFNAWLPMAATSGLLLSAYAL
jgi:hypothetical protein